MSGNSSASLLLAANAADACNRGCQPTEREHKTLAKPVRHGRKKWRRTDLNRRPSACKADALPTELRPRKRGISNCPVGRPMKNSPAKRPHVGARRFELRTSSLSATRSNQLSYAPQDVVQSDNIYRIERRIRHYSRSGAPSVKRGWNDALEPRPYRFMRPQYHRHSACQASRKDEQFYFRFGHAPPSTDPKWTEDAPTWAPV